MKNQAQHAAKREYTVFYLHGGNLNFVCHEVIGRMTLEEANAKVADIRRWYMPALAVKNGHQLGGFESHTDFETNEEKKAYFDSCWKFAIPNS